MKKKIILPALVFALISCGNNTTEKSNASSGDTLTTEQNNTVENAPDIHTSQNALDYGGTYEGTIPCADCSGIEVLITLDYQGNYTKKMTYSGKEPDNVFSTKGTYKWDNEGRKITLSGENDPEIYQVGENRLIMLDKNGDKITGEHADMYVLQQTQITINN